MTLSKRAEKILNIVHLPMSRPDGTTVGEVLDAIESELQAAVEEAQKIMAEELTKADREHVKQAMDLAYEKAARVLDAEEYRLRVIVADQLHTVDALQTEREAERLEQLAATIRALKESK